MCLRVLGSVSLTNARLGDLINGFRQTLDLEPVPTSEGPLLHETLKIPFTYCWSQALVPKPFDWGSHIGMFVPALIFKTFLPLCA